MYGLNLYYVWTFEIYHFVNSSFLEYQFEYNTQGDSI